MNPWMIVLALCCSKYLTGFDVRVESSATDVFLCDRSNVSRYDGGFGNMYSRGVSMRRAFAFFPRSYD